MLYKAPAGGVVSRPNRIGKTFIGSQTDLTQYGYLPVTPDKPTAPDGQQAVVTDGSEVGGEWVVTWVFEAIPAPVVEPVELGVLTVIKWAIAADSTDETVLTYTSDDAVQFVVDSVLYEVEPVGQVATLAISADAAGTINIYVQGQQVVIAAYEVTP